MRMVVATVRNSSESHRFPVAMFVVRSFDGMVPKRIRMHCALLLQVRDHLPLQ